MFGSQGTHPPGGGGGGPSAWPSSGHLYPFDKLGRHARSCEEESVIQISGNGPFDIIYANPKDDPRKQQEAK
jgi:hypothetical protein